MKLINKFDVFGTMQTATIANIPLNMNCVQWSGMVHDECKIIPYHSDELKQAVECLATEVGNEHGWTYINYAKTRTSLMVNIEQNKVDLLIEVFPDLIPQDEREELMQWHLSGTTKGSTEYEEIYSEIQNFFNEVDEFYSFSVQTGEFMIADIELSDSECNAILWGLVQELE